MRSNPVERPNLLFVFSDQHRAMDLGCYGNDEVSSPRFDAFAREGARFVDCVSNNPVCVPMRGSMLTALHAWHHRALTIDLPIRTDLESIAAPLSVELFVSVRRKMRSQRRHERRGFEGFCNIRNATCLERGLNIVLHCVQRDHVI